LFTGGNNPNNSCYEAYLVILGASGGQLALHKIIEKFSHKTMKIININYFIEYFPFRGNTSESIWVTINIEYFPVPWSKDSSK
jgi:hypothetical protein